MDESRSYTNLSYEELLKEVEDNHMWINAFSTLNPSDDLKMGIGEWVLEQLKTTTVKDSMGISPTAIFRVNKS